MAKVNGPLFSLEASGKVADAMVYFGWKELHVVREWLKPTQPRPAAVMNMRIKYKALGKVSKIFSATSTLRADIIAKTPSGSIWNADWIGVAIKQFQKDNAAFDTFEADMNGATDLPAIDDRAGALGLADLTLTVEGKSSDHPVTYGRAMAFYSLMKACWYREVLDENEVAYTDPKAWATAKIVAFYGRVID